MISTSEIKVSCIIAADDIQKLLKLFIRFDLGFYRTARRRPVINSVARWN